MAAIKCKMCGGDLNISEGTTVAECEYCGSKQTIPNQDNEKKLTLFARADRLRRACEFDKAAGVYESIVAEFPEEAEAYWGLALCRYGIEYVDDPATRKKVPTCHRSSFDSILEDTDFEQACENADAIARRIYRDEAKVIEDIRRGILEVSGKEDPYDIFICYKETDENGERTIDSVIAQDVYDALTEKGYRVFFSRISLEDKLGTEYEPYIFAALNSARVMLVFGTDYEYFNAVWVKNEWSRFLALIAAGQKKTLIPCYKGVDAYDMPKEFRRLQAQDMGKVGAIQDLLRGIGKIIGEMATVVSAPSNQPVAMWIEPFLKLGNSALQEGEWDKAEDFFDQAVALDPECAEAHAGKMCVEMKYRTLSNITQDSETWVGTKGKTNKNYMKVLRYGSPDLKNEIEGYITAAIDAWKETTYHLACSAMDEANYPVAIEKFALVQGYRDAGKRAAECVRLAEEIYTSACSAIDEADYRTAIEKFTLVKGYRDADKKLAKYRELPSHLISAGHSCTVAVRANGAVVAVGNYQYGQCDVKNWTNIVAVSAGGGHTVGLKADGTVVAVGHNSYGECDVKEWGNIIAVSAGLSHTVGLRADGTVVTTGENEDGQCSVESWTDVVAVYAGFSCTIGLKSDGTVVVAGSTELDGYNVKNWTNIVAVSAGESHTVGLKSDGTVVAAGTNTDGRCNVESWTDIVTVSAGESHTVGLKSDGTVVATGTNTDERCNVESWTDIATVSAGGSHTVGLKSDGTVVATGTNTDGRCSVWGWKLFNSLTTLEQEREEPKQQRQEEVHRKEDECYHDEKHRQKEERNRKKSALQSEQTALRAELAGLRGLFTGRRRRELEARLAEIEAEQKNL